MADLDDPVSESISGAMFIAPEFRFMLRRQLPEASPQRDNTACSGTGLADFQRSDRQDAATLNALKEDDLAALHLDRKITGDAHVYCARHCIKRRRIVGCQADGICCRGSERYWEVFELIHNFFQNLTDQCASAD